jgi:uncharacterized protein GlcG (DUF336 family)
MPVSNRTYISLDLPNAAAALAVAQKIANQKVAPVTVVDDDGNVIASVSADSCRRNYR